MFNSNCASVPLVASIDGNNNGNGMFGGDGWWAIIIFALIFGWGGNGFGGGFGCGFGGNRGGFVEPCATQADVRAAVDQQTLISKLDQQTYGLADSTYALNNAITSGFHGVDNAICNLGYNVQSGFNSLGHQISDCCCTTQRSIDNVRYDMATQACDTRNLIQNTTRDIIDNANANNRALLDFLVKDKIETLQAENQSLRLTASQERQNNVLRAAMDANTAEIIRRTGNECPIPAYVVPNPNCCYNPFGFGYSNNSCGCGCA
jgi:hypothetical protein